LSDNHSNSFQVAVRFADYPGVIALWLGPRCGFPPPTAPSAVVMATWPVYQAF
jgi:hypothetical protein